MEQASQNWEPTDSQKAVLESAQKRGYSGTVLEWCEEAGIVARTYYGYYDTPAFCVWWRREWEAYFARVLPVVMADLVSMARGSNKGKPEAAKILLERFDRGYAPRRREEVSGPNGGPVQVQQRQEFTFDISTRGELPGVDAPVEESAPAPAPDEGAG